MYGEWDDAWPPAVQADMAIRLGARHRVVPLAGHSRGGRGPGNHGHRARRVLGRGGVCGVAWPARGTAGGTERLVVELHAALSADPGQVAVARRLLRGYLADRASDRPANSHDVPVLLLSELVTNAIRHAQPPLVLRAATARAWPPGRGARRRHRPPGARITRPPPDELPLESGRGLFLVASLADRWGWDGHSVRQGRLVRARRALGPGAGPAGRPRAPWSARRARPSGQCRAKSHQRAHRAGPRRERLGPRRRVDRRALPSTPPRPRRPPHRSPRRDAGAGVRDSSVWTHRTTLALGRWWSSTVRHRRRSVRSAPRA